MGVAAALHRPAEPEDRLAPSLRRTAGEQLVVASGQLGAGLGNLAFALVMARVLAPASFSKLASFLALYLLLGLPTQSLSAATALAPGRDRALDRRVARAATAAGLAVAGTAPWLAPALHLTIGAVVALGLLAPAVGALGLERGRLYGSARHLYLVGSLLGEPAVRLSLGVAAGALFGVTGAAVGVVAAAYAALAVARRGLLPAPHRLAPVGRAPADGSARPGVGPWTMAAFLVLAVVQNQDLILANRVLPAVQAGRFAVLSTLGGAVAFATLTIPLVLLPRMAGGQRRALGAALGVAAGLGGAGVALALAFPTPIVTDLFGSRYAAVAPLAAPYLGAMALLGLARVLVASWSTTGRHRAAVALLLGAGGIQAGMILAGGRTAASVALATVTSTSALAAGLGAVEAGRWVRDRAPELRVVQRLRARPVPAAAWAVGGLTVGGLIVRLLIPRGLWLDEATSVFQARMPFGAMLHNLLTTDVHPPGWYAVLWGTVRVFGSGELAVRLPSIAAGTLLVPMLYLTGKELYDRRTGYVAAAAGVVSPFLVWYSQEARMYSQFLLLAVVAVWAQVRVIKRDRPLDWCLYTLASAALIWTQYFSGLQVAVQQVAFVAVAVHRHREGGPARAFALRWLASLVALVGLISPLVPFAYHQYAVNQATGKGFALTPSQAGNGASTTVAHLSIYSLLANVVWLGWGYHSDPAMEAIVALWPLGMLMTVFVLGRRRQWTTTLLITVAAVPILVLFGVGFVKRDLFDARYFSGAAALGVVLMARVVTGAARRRGAVIAATCLLVASFGVALFDQQTNGSNPRTYSFREAVHSLNVEGRPGDTVLYAPGSIGTVVGYYDHGRYTLRGMSTNLARDGGRGRVFVLISPRLMSPGQPRVYGRVLSDLGQHRHLVGRRHFDNVDIWEFS